MTPLVVLKGQIVLPHRPRRRRSPAQIPLVLLGLTLQGCNSPPPPPAPVVRDRYASAAECAADWGRPESCEAEEASGGSSASSGGAGGAHGGGGTYFRGPAYMADARGAAQSEVISNARQQGLAVDAAGNRSIGRVSLGNAAGRAGGLGNASRGGFGATGHALGAGAS